MCGTGHNRAVVFMGVSHVIVHCGSVGDLQQRNRWRGVHAVAISLRVVHAFAVSLEGNRWVVHALAISLCCFAGLMHKEQREVLAADTYKYLPTSHSRCI